MIHKRLRDYDRSPVFSGRFQNLAGEHGKVGFKYTADDFGCDGCIPANQPVAKGNDPLLNCRSIQQAMGCSGLPGSDGASPTISNWRFAPLASQEFLEFARYEATGKRWDRMRGQPRITRHCIARFSGIKAMQQRCRAASAFRITHSNASYPRINRLRKEMILY